MALWTTETAGDVVVARYANPPMNYFTRHAMAELAVLIQAWRDPAVRVVILTGGVPDRFITHYSCEELLKLVRRPDLIRSLGPSIGQGFHDLLRDLSRLQKPVIAAMSGDTMGGGFELSLACDIRIAATGDCRYGLPEATLGIIPGGSGTQRLSRLLGPGRAVEFMLRGRLVKPERALALNLVHELAYDPLARAMTVARELALLAPAALAGIKRAAWDGAAPGLAHGLALEAQVMAEVFLAPETEVILAAYVALPFEQRRDWLERHRALQG